MSHLLTLLVSLAGFISICLSMDRHQEDLLNRTLAANWNLLLRLSGWVMLAIAYWIAVRAFGWGIGTVAWIGHLGAAAGLVMVSLILHGRRTAR